MNTPTTRFLFLIAFLILPFVAHSQDSGSSEEEIFELNPYIVETDQGTRGYATTNTLGGTRINTLLENTPQNIASLNAEVLKDINPSTLADALRFVSGISLAEGEYSNRISLRGVQVNAIGNLDGLGENNSAAHGSRLVDPIEIERLEVIKGPAGILYGSHSFGGVINRVVKRPLEVSHVIVGGGITRYGSDEDYYRLTLDATGPLDEDKKFLYRVLYANQDGNNHMHDTFARETFIGELDFHPSKETTFRVRYRYSDQQVFVAQDMWTDSELNMPFGYIPQDAYVGNFWEDDQVDSFLGSSISGDWIQSFSIGGLRFDMKVNAAYGESTAQRRTYIALGGLFYKNGAPLVVDGTALTTRNSTWETVDANGYDDIRENIIRRDIRNGENDNWGINVDLTTNLELGPTYHRVLTYVSTGSGNSYSRRFRENWVVEPPSIYDPVSIDPSAALDGIPETRANEWFVDDTESLAFAIVDNIKMLDDRLIFLGGYRYDEGRTETFDGLQEVEVEPFSDNQWTPTYGVVGKPAEGVSLFYLHSETFQFNGAVNQSGNRLKPLIGENDEVGIKLDMFESRLVATASYFDMSQENAPLKIINDDGSFYFDQTDDQVTDGWELDVAFQLMEGLSVLFAIQDIEAVDQSNGRKVRSVPQGVNYNTLVRYAFRDDSALAGLTCGLSFVHVNDTREGDTGNSFQLPGYDLWGVFASYDINNVQLRLNIQNLTDEWYVAGSTSSLFMRSGVPRVIKFDLTYRF